MRIALCFALLVGCSFQHGLAPTGMDAHEPVDADVDAPTVPPVDAAVDAHVCPSDFVSIVGGQPTSRYKFYPYSENGGGNNGTATFAKARMTCAMQGAYVAVPNDASELSAVDAIAQNPQLGGYWVGLNDMAVDGTWRTELGDVAMYLPWATGQPNGGLAAACVVGFQRTLYDVDCALSYPFVCECTP